MAHIGQCINWNKSLTHSGYGQIKRNGKTYRAHRYFYEQEFGAIPEGMVLDHLCRNRACINLIHLEVVSIAENTRRGSSTKLDYQKVKEIRKLYKKGEIQMNIADMYKIGQDQVSRIVNLRRWA